MKKILALFTAAFVAVSAFSQTVNVVVNGNRDYQVVIDGQVYTGTISQMGAGKKNEVTINNLPIGQHRIEVYRLNASQRRSGRVYASTFTTKPDHDLRIQVNGNSGRVRLVETSNDAAFGDEEDRYNDRYNETYRAAMSDADFNRIYVSIRNRWLPGSKMNAAVGTFNTATYNFSSYQARQIIALVTNEANRLELAKLAYDNIVDPANYYNQVYDLLATQASRDELRYFINYR